MPRAMNNSIEIRGLSKKYANGTIGLDELTISIPEGTLFALTGPNGAGKSTTINIVAGILRKSAGEISVFGEKVTDHDYEYKRSIGFVLERPHYIEKLTGGEYLRFVAAMYGVESGIAEKRVLELLAFFDLEEKRNDLIESYSAGMKKKISLAAALIHHPRLLILDEPLEGIDPVAASQIKGALKEMVAKGATILLSSHLLDTVEKLCDKVAILNKGKLVFQSDMVDIRTTLKTQTSRETYQSLEEIFLDTVVSDGERKQSRGLSWL